MAEKFGNTWLAGFCIARNDAVPFLVFLIPQLD